jgi:DNA repair exonuclease SbcCD ATPase subunit
MLKSLTLKNFRKHEDLTLNFGKGLTVIRGENEKGKTSISEAILYALFGATMLREPLDMVVTYDKPETSLKVTLEFEVSGVSYIISRGKSGAELRYEDQFVTGQKETRLFVEKLLSCTAATANRLMFANQSDIRGVLSEGGSAANGLVETLAQLGLIEQLINKIQEQLPSGNTKAIEAQIETLKETAVEVPEVPNKYAISQAEAVIAQIAQKIGSSESSIRPDQEVAIWADAIQRKNAVEAEISRLTARKAQISAILSKRVTLPAFTLEGLQQARKDAANLAEQARRWKASKVRFPTCEVEWDGDFDSAKAYRVEMEEAVAKLTADVTSISQQIEIEKVKRINEKVCAFCKKDLSEVAEVATLNSQVDQRIATLAANLANIKQQLEESKSNLKSIKLVIAVTETCYQLAGEYWDLTSSIPPKPVWKGAPATAPGSIDISGMEKEWETYQQTLADRRALERELESFVIPTVPDTSTEEQLLEEQKRIKQELQTLRIELEKAKAELSKIAAAYEAAISARQAALAMKEANSKAIADLTATRNQMLKHNDLIRKLRLARPEIAASMWGVVLGAVSHYFTKARGEESIVTRTAEGFKVNGKSIAGLSGSTNDMLGLAIRMALSKLFLPNASFLFLDESFSACDSGRELAGIATLASAGFEQVLLVTHSDLPEQIADTLIQL